MNKRIQTYQDLVDEKKQLEALLVVHKATLRQDVEDIKQELAPLRSAVSFVSRLLIKRDSNFLVDAGISTLVNVGVKKFLLARAAGWLTRLVVPFLVKNFSSNVVVKNKKAILKKLFSWIGKRNANGHVKHPDFKHPDYN